MTKSTKRPGCPAETQISLGVCPVWSESSLSAWRNIGPLTIYWAHSGDSDQTGQMPRLIWVFAGRTCHFFGFVLQRLICCWIPTIYVFMQKYGKLPWVVIKYINGPKFLDRHVWANSVDPDQTAPGAVWWGSTVCWGSTLFVIHSASFGLSTLW